MSVDPHNFAKGVNMVSLAGDNTDGAVAFKSITPVRAYEGVVAQIEEAIYSGRLAPGSRLPSERNLMLQFHVSRSTIREALRVLASEGLVRSRPGDPNGGAEVLEGSPQRVSRALNHFVRLGQIGTLELVQFRMIVEGSAIRLAAYQRTEEQFAEIQRAYSEMERAAKRSRAEFSEADVAFHVAVSRCSGNPLLSACSDFATDMVLGLVRNHMIEATDHEALMRDTLSRHGRYLRAIEEQDGARAETLARRDLFEYYAPYVEEAQRSQLEVLLQNVEDDAPGLP